MPNDWCPFCPGSGRVPDDYDVYIYDNDFPALSPNPPAPDPVATSLYKTAPAYGKCEVVLYSPDHHTTLPQLSQSHIRKVVDLWTERFVELGRDPRHEYILIFENRGPEVGVTMPHPHGQIYAYPYIPLKLRAELEACREHHEQTGRCLICDIQREELSFGRRMVLESDHFLVYIPFFTDYPYGVFISSRSHRTALPEFSDAEKDDLAQVLKLVTAGMDALFDREFPYMMVLHQRPVHHTDVTPYYHFHIEFYPPLRDRDKIKYLASSETGAWAPCNPTAVEETAPRLRAAIERVKEEMSRHDDAR
jgi:UDPglucose--hexose-1-phosphate uridylyltransferase